MLRQALNVTAGVAAGAAGASAAVLLLYRHERSRIPKDSELICSSHHPASPPTVLKRLATDNLMGGFDAYYLAATWCYDQPIDAESVKATLAELGADVSGFNECVKSTRGQDKC